MRKKLKAVLVGCGNISQFWLSALKGIPEILIVGLADIIEEKAEKRAKEFDLHVQIDSSLASLLNKVECEVVFDCTPPCSRLMVVTTAFEYNCSILVEKPLADSLCNANKIVVLAEKEQKICAVMQNYRYNDAIRQMASFVKAGNLGEITECNSSFYIGTHFEDFRKSLGHVLLKDMAIHTFDSARFIFGDDSASVFCSEWNPHGSHYEHGASAVAIFKFNTGIIYTYQGSWTSKGLRTPWESIWRINGTKGSLCWDGGESFKVEILGDNKPQSHGIKDIPITKDSAVFSGHEKVIRHFIKSIIENKEPETTCSDNIKSLSMVFAAIESSEKNEKVKIGA